jgi:hypothetical protein
MMDPCGRAAAGLVLEAGTRPRPLPVVLIESSRCDHCVSVVASFGMLAREGGEPNGQTQPFNISFASSGCTAGCLSSARALQLSCDERRTCRMSVSRASCRRDLTRAAVLSGGARFLGDQVTESFGRRDDDEEDCQPTCSLVLLQQLYSCYPPVLNSSRRSLP